MIERCACFSTDLGYIFPTVLAAIQARKLLDPQIADVVIILFDAAPAKAAVIEKICEQNQIILLCPPNEALQGFGVLHSRLFLADLLPDKYQRVLYMDGDIQITGSLDAFIQTELPSNSDFAAVPDPMAIELHEGKSDQSKKIQSYFEGLGVKSSIDRPYFNSGILLINLPQWAVIGRDAIKFQTEAPAKCQFHDQSAANFAGHTKMTPMSFRWNFPIFFRNCGVEKQIAPSIYHFMSKPKPWDGVFAPWNQDFFEPYVKLIAQYPELHGYTKQLAQSARLKYFGQQNYKRIYETITWRYSARRPIILEFNAATKL